jgi:hypothetical protein
VAAVVRVDLVGHGVEYTRGVMESDVFLLRELPASFAKDRIAFFHDRLEGASIVPGSRPFLRSHGVMACVLIGLQDREEEDLVRRGQARQLARGVLPDFDLIAKIRLVIEVVGSRA